MFDNPKKPRPAYSLFTRFATSPFAHFHSSMTRGVAHSMKARVHFQARRPAFVANSTARSNRGSHGLSGGILARVQATISQAISVIARHSMASGTRVRRLQRQRALRHRVTLLRRQAKAREFIRDSGALAALLVKPERQIIGARGLFRRAALACLGLVGELPDLQNVLVDLPNRLVDLERHGLIFGEQFVSLSGHIAKKRAQSLALHVVVIGLRDVFVGQIPLRAIF